MSTQTYSLKAGEWKTVGGWWGFSSKKLCFSVTTSKKCSWQRIAVVPGWGRFREKICKNLFNGVIRVKSPEDATCKSWFT